MLWKEDKCIIYINVLIIYGAYIYIYMLVCQVCKASYQEKTLPLSPPLPPPSSPAQPSPPRALMDAPQITQVIIYQADLSLPGTGMANKSQQDTL